MTTPASRYGKIPYGLYKYGSTGTESVGTYLWALEVDWDGDGVFDGSNEAGRMTDIDITRGRKTFLQPNGQGFYPIQPGNAKITLDNHDGRYDAWNSSSDLYPNVTYGKDVRLKAIDAATGSTYSVFYGVLSDIIPIGYGSTAFVKLIAEDTLSYLRNTNPETNESTGGTLDAAIGRVLDNSGWLSRWGRNLSTSSTTIPYFWCEKNTTSANQCANVANSYFGYFFVDGTGRATYKDRVDTSTATIAYTESVIQKDISLPQPWVNYRDTSKIEYLSINGFFDAYQVIEQTRADTNGINLQPNTTYRLFIKNETRFDTAAYPAVEVALGFQRDITFTPASTNSFVFMYPSSTYSSSSTYLSTSYWNTYSITETVYGLNVTLNHSYPSTTVYIRAGKIADLVDISTNSAYYPTSTSTSNRTFSLNTKWIQDTDTANSMVSIVGAFLAANQKFPVIQVVNRPPYQFPELFNKVTLNLPTLGISTENFRVGGLEHVGTPQSLKTTIWLEKYIST